MKIIRNSVVLILSLFLFGYANVFAQGDVMATVETFIQTKYPGSVTIDIDNDDGKIEVEIVHERKEKDLDFNSRGEWLKTSYELEKSDLPRNIKEALKSSAYSSYSVDDVEFNETPKDSYYKIDLEKWFSDDVTVYISSSGKIL